MLLFNIVVFISCHVVSERSIRNHSAAHCSHSQHRNIATKDVIHTGSHVRLSQEHQTFGVHKATGLNSVEVHPAR